MKVIKVESLHQVILYTVVLRTGSTVLITNYICLVMINWTVSSENCEKVIFRYYVIGHFRKIFKSLPLIF